MAHLLGMFSQQPIERISSEYAHLPMSYMRLCPAGSNHSRFDQCHLGRYARPIYRVAIYARGDQNDIIQQVLHCQLALAPLLQEHTLLTYLYTDLDVMSLPDSMCMEEPHGLWALTDGGVHNVFDIVAVNALDRLTDGKATLYDEVVEYLLGFGLTILVVDEGCLFGDEMMSDWEGREDTVRTPMPPVELEEF